MTDLRMISCSIPNFGTKCSPETTGISITKTPSLFADWPINITHYEAGLGKQQELFESAFSFDGYLHGLGTKPPWRPK